MSESNRRESRRRDRYPVAPTAEPPADKGATGPLLGAAMLGLLALLAAPACSLVVGSDGVPCSGDADCGPDQRCQDGACVPDSATASCDDGRQNGSETDIDCGGPACPACADGQSCAADGDCQSGFCDAGSCSPQADHCSNDSRDAGETDVDCGGADCPPCPLAAGCLADADCYSGLCQQDSCALSRGQPMPGDGNPVDALAVDILRETVPAFAGDYLIATGADDRHPRLFRFSAANDGGISQLVVDMDHISGPIIQVAFQRQGLDGQDYLFSINSTRGIKRWDPYEADSPYVIFHNLSGAVFATTPEDGRWVAGGRIGVLGTNAAVIWDGTGSGGTPCTSDTPTACEAIVYMDPDTTISGLAFSPELSLGMSTPTLLAAGSNDAGVLDAGLRLWSSSDWVGWAGGAGGVDPLVTLEPGNRISGLAFHPAPQTPLLAALIETPDSERAIHIYDVSDWQTPPAEPQPAVVALEAGVHATALAFAPDTAEPALLVATDSGFVSAVCDTGDGWRLRYSAEVQAPAGIFDLAISDDGRWLVSGEPDAFRIWHLPSLLALLGCSGS